MFGIKVRDKQNIDKNKENINEKLNNKKGRIYIEIKPETEIVVVEDEKQLKLLNELEEIKALPNKLPPLKENEVCGHWEREIIFLSAKNPKLWRKTKNDIIVGGYCPDCGADLGQPKPKWYPAIYYKKE